MIRILVLLAALSGMGMIGSASAQTAQPFGVPPGNDPKWQGVLQDIKTERALLAKCRLSPQDCPSDRKQAAFSFIDVLDEAASKDGLSRIGHLNRSVNLALNARDTGCAVTHGWTTPLTALKAHCGDCEEYVTLKAVGLLELGFSPDDVRIVVGGSNPKLHEYYHFHAVVAVKYDGAWLILDNSLVTGRLVRDTEKPDFLAYFTLSPIPPETYAGN
jgi:predicted transglutaminase-like cysteine proteinase